jgi:phage shock protein PspC (stress-responsive transcriptional regulator)
VTNQFFNKNSIAIIVGALLVIIGLYQLALRFFGEMLGAIWRVVGTIIGILGPLVVIAIGILLVIAARRDVLTLPTNRKLYRSTSNKKIAGICGGMAEYFSVDPATIRIFAIVLGVIAWYVVVPLYLLFWIIVPPDASRFHTWG